MIFAWNSALWRLFSYFFLSANDGNAAIGDNNGDISGDNQSYSNKVLLLLEKDLILQQKEWASRQVWAPERLVAL